MSWGGNTWILQITWLFLAASCWFQLAIAEEAAATEEKTEEEKLDFELITNGFH